MADLIDIRRGLAANLSVLTDFQVSLYLLANPTPPTIQIAGVEHIDYDIEFQGPDGYDATGDRLTVQIEAALQKGTERSGQEQLDRLHSATGLKNAVESDNRLTSRLQDDGSILISQEPACDDLRVTEYVGASDFTVAAGKQVLLATWRVEVLT